MDPLKNCDMCGGDSNDTAIFTCAYAKGEMNICLECLTHGIHEISRDMNKQIKNEHLQEIDELLANIQPMRLEEFEVKMPADEVFGFNCESCSEVMFSKMFPAACPCGHVNQDSVLSTQDIIHHRSTGK
jgi:hypothetical protein